MDVTTDESEVAALRARVAALEGLLMEHERAAATQADRTKQLVADLTTQARTFQATLRSIADAVVVCDTEGRFLHFNAAAEAVLGMGAMDVASEEWSQVYGCFFPDGVTPYPSNELPLVRAIRGEPVDGAELVIRNPHRPAGTYIEAYARSIQDEEGARIGAVVVFRDITERKRHQMEMERNLASEREKNAALERLRVTVRELSAPILEVWDDILALPLIGVVDSRRVQVVMRCVLESIVEKQCRFVIIDITGVDVLDSATADHLLRIVQAVELLGAKSVLTGIRPSVAQTLVELGVAFGSLVTLRTLKDGLRACLRWKAEGATHGGCPVRAPGRQDIDFGQCANDLFSLMFLLRLDNPGLRALQGPGGAMGSPARFHASTPPRMAAVLR